MAAAEEGARRLLESIEDNKRHTKVVQAWLTKHNDPMYVTDLWFVVKEGEKEIRIPACSAILRVTCGLVRDLPETGDVPVLGDHSVATVVKVVQACYPFGSEDFLENEKLRGLVAITNFAHWCGAQMVIDRLLVKMSDKVYNENHSRKPFVTTYKAVFSILDTTGKWGAKSIFDCIDDGEYNYKRSSSEDYLVGKWPSFFLDLPEAERAPFARHAKRMFRYFLEFNKQKWSAHVNHIQQKGRDKRCIVTIDDATVSAMNDMHRAMEYLTNSA